MPDVTRVLLITPPYHCGMVESAGVWMPLGLAYLAGSLRAAGFQPCIYDAMSLFHTPEEIARQLAERRPDVVAVTAYTATVHAALQVLRDAKAAWPSVVTVIGGVHPTFMAEDVLADPALDYVVRGEGEVTLPALLACLRDGGDPATVPGIAFRRADGAVVQTPERPLVADLDALPVAWDLLDWPLYHYRTKPGSRLAIVSWARGCTHRCSFCSQHKFWRGTWRPRDITAVVEELRLLREVYGVDTVEVADEWPTRDGARWAALLDRLIAADLGIELLVETRVDDILRDADRLADYRAAGILHLYVGVESVHQHRLDAMRKAARVADAERAIGLLNAAGIITETSFLLGFPDETPATIAETIALAKRYDPDLAFFIPITPWPYADWAAEVAERIADTDYRHYNLIEPIITPDAMTREEVLAMTREAFITFYRHKMQQLPRLPAHKRDYLRRVAALLMDHSYLAREARDALAPAPVELA